MATLVPDVAMDRIFQEPNNLQSIGNSMAELGNDLEQEVIPPMDLTEKTQNLERIRQHAMKLVQQYQSDFSIKIQKWVSEFTNQVKLLFLN